MISKEQDPDPLEDARASTAYSLPTSSANHNSQDTSDDFGSINNQREETFTLSGFPSSETTSKTSPSISDRIQPLITYVNSMDRQNLALRGCGIGAAFAFVILAGVILKRRSAA